MLKVAEGVPRLSSSPPPRSSSSQTLTAALTVSVLLAMPRLQSWSMTLVSHPWQNGPLPGMRSWLTTTPFEVLTSR